MVLFGFFFGFLGEEGGARFFSVFLFVLDEISFESDPRRERLVHAAREASHAGGTRRERAPPRRNAAAVPRRVQRGSFERVA